MIWECINRMFVSLDVPNILIIFHALMHHTASTIYPRFPTDRNLTCNPLPSGMTEILLMETDKSYVRKLCLKYETWVAFPKWNNHIALGFSWQLSVSLAPGANPGSCLDEFKLFFSPIVLFRIHLNYFQKQVLGSNIFWRISQSYAWTAWRSASHIFRGR